VKVGVIGGSGLYKMDKVKITGELKVSTPFGDPSGRLLIGKLIGDDGKMVENCELVFLPRHGYGHEFMPTEVNYRANIFAMKSLGVEWIIGVSAVGSLRENIDKGHIVVADQFIDKTKFRNDSFFGDGVVGHAPWGDPCCNVLRNYLLDSCKTLGASFSPATDGAFTVHEKGTYVNMEGPAFSSRAESEMHRQWGAQVIGMTACPEAKLCREAEISYAVLAMATDYDSWKEDEDDVTVDAVVATLERNVKNAQNVVMKTIPLIAKHAGAHPMEGRMAGAIMTKESLIPYHKRQEMAPIIKQYVNCEPTFKGWLMSLIPEWNTTTALVCGLVAGAGLMVTKGGK